MDKPYGHCFVLFEPEPTYGFPEIDFQRSGFWPLPPLTEEQISKINKRSWLESFRRGEAEDPRDPQFWESMREHLYQPIYDHGYLIFGQGAALDDEMEDHDLMPWHGWDFTTFDESEMLEHFELGENGFILPYKTSSDIIEAIKTPSAVPDGIVLDLCLSILTCPLDRFGQYSVPKSKREKLNFKMGKFLDDVRSAYMQRSGMSPQEVDETIETLKAFKKFLRSPRGL